LPRGIRADKVAAERAARHRDTGNILPALWGWAKPSTRRRSA